MKGFNRLTVTLIVASLCIPLLGGCSGGGDTDKAGVEKGDVIGTKPKDALPKPVGNTRVKPSAETSQESADAHSN